MSFLSSVIKRKDPPPLSKVDDAAQDVKPKKHKKDTEPKEPERSSDREKTKKNSEASKKKADEAASKNTGNHVKAKGRAQTPVKDKPTDKINQAEVDKLKENKAYKDGTTRVHFKGDRFDGQTTGMPVDGKHMKRGNWMKEMKQVRDRLGDALMGKSSFTPAKNNSKQHGSENAHIRPQHSGGRTDALGAQPASWHSNVEDMAREEGLQALYKKLGKDNVRHKSTSYVFENGAHTGTQRASRHKIYIKNGKGEWKKKFDHLQDGHRGNIDKNEAKAIKDRISKLTSQSSNANLHKKKDDHNGVPANKPARREEKTPIRNNSLDAPYFTDVKTSGGTVHKKQDAQAHVEDLFAQGSKYSSG